LKEAAAVRMPGSEEQVPEGAGVDRTGARESAEALGFAGAKFETVFLAHYGRVIAILRRIVGEAGRAEELASEVFLKLYRRGPTGARRGESTEGESSARDSAIRSDGDGDRIASVDDAGGGNLAGWLYRTATNLGIDALRAGARRMRFEQDAARDGGGRIAAAEDGYDRTLRGERQRRVRAVLGELKVAQAQLLFLRAEGFSYKELAEAVGVEASSVGTLLVRAEAAFAERYRELFGEEAI
jgi:RNA polymerase sigma factor (sigma-70 family)